MDHLKKNKQAILHESLATSWLAGENTEMSSPDSSFTFEFPRMSASTMAPNARYIDDTLNEHEDSMSACLTIDLARLVRQDARLQCIHQFPMGSINSVTKSDAVIVSLEKDYRLGRPLMVLETATKSDLGSKEAQLTAYVIQAQERFTDTDHNFHCFGAIVTPDMIRVFIYHTLELTPGKVILGYSCLKDYRVREAGDMREFSQFVSSSLARLLELRSTASAKTKLPFQVPMLLDGLPGWPLTEDCERLSLNCILVYGKVIKMFVPGCSGRSPDAFRVSGLPNVEVLECRGDVKLVRYDYIETGDETKEKRDEISERLSKFHEAGYIFADMRVGNVVFGKEHGFIIDFDLARLASENPVYSDGFQWNNISHRHKDARPGNWMSSDHDTYSLGQMFENVV
jgi:hypothetical protein